MKVTSVRFFLAVAPHPAWVWIGFGLVVVLGAWAMAGDPREGDSALGAALLIQMFAVSTGFRSPASRGHFDAVLVTGRSRSSIVLAHFVASAMPGWLGWTALGAMEGLIFGSDWPLALSLRGLSAVLVVSVIAWALSVSLPRLSGGAIWCVAILVAALTREGFTTLADEVVDGTRADTLTGLLRSAIVHVAVPFLLIRREPPVPETALCALGLGVALIGVALAIAYLVIRDYPLVEER